ncbi:hypothetical protein TNCT_443411 [Trichonephila clavata]|uniref:Uncharacterized protein n=1 Tax=Trichonephila clavata TaxID=2740835 RepID=A0A8X6GBE2_TRICU|nr:hypothetical protein TNCT_443411 [Trichonephila clavata]
MDSEIPVTLACSIDWICAQNGKKNWIKITAIFFKTDKVWLYYYDPTIKQQSARTPLLQPDRLGITLPTPISKIFRFQNI